MKVIPLILLAACMSLARNADNGKRLFVRDGCYQCHGYAGQGSIAGARLAPPVLNAQGMAKYIRRPAGGMPRLHAGDTPDVAPGLIFGSFEGSVIIKLTIRKSRLRRLATIRQSPPPRRSSNGSARLTCSSGALLARATPI